MVFTGVLFDSNSFVVGYLNNDNRLDVVAASHPSSIITKDINHDHFLDLIITNYGTDPIAVLLGYGNGSFAIGQTYSTDVASSPQSVADGDFNHDNEADIPVAYSGNDGIPVVFGNSNETFTNKVTLSTDFGSCPTSLTIADFDNNTFQDIVVASSGTDTIGIFLNNANHTFTNQTRYQIVQDLVYTQFLSPI